MKKERPRIERVERQSAPLVAEQVAKLKEAFPEAVTEGKVDFEKLRATLGDEIDDRPERYSFNWAGKRDAIRLLQTPSRATLTPAPKESVNFEETSNVFIEGENLEVLKLLYKSYFGRVKMIYIDPPYNTGNDFIYPDNYTDPLDTYLRLTGQKDSEGNLLTSNPETSGRYHSSWLSMIYPRLVLARQILQEGGVIFVSIDDYESHNLRLVMNEVFGEENFVAQIVWKKAYGGGAKVKHVVGLHEYVVCYARNKEVLGSIDLPPDPEARKYYKFKDSKYSTRGPYRTQPLWTNSMDVRTNLRYPILWKGRKIRPERQWQWEEPRVKQALKDDELVFVKKGKGWSVYYKQYLRDENGEERAAKPYSVLEGPYTQRGTAEIEELFGNGKVFPFPKPTALIRYFLNFAWQDKNAIVLDFFAGSGTTAQALMETNAEDQGRRRFIMVQLPEPTPKDSPARNAGFKTIAEIGKERIRRVVGKMTQEGKGKSDLGFKVLKLSQSNFRPWEELEAKEPTLYSKQMEFYLDPLTKGWKPENVIWEVAIKEGYGLTSRIEKITGAKNGTIYRVSDPEKEQSFYICLDDKIKLGELKSINLKQDDLFICRDIALDDEAAANLALQCRLKTI